MLIRIRKESFGYIAFETKTRNHHFIYTNEQLEKMTKKDLYNFLANYYKNNDYKYEFIIPSEHSSRLSAPLAMYLEITDNCNMNCKHCYKPFEPKKTSLDKNEKIALLKQLRDMGIFEIRLCGNEPTASNDFLEICEYIKKLNFHLSLNTNGYLSEKLQEKIIILEPDSIVISIEGDEYVHDKIRIKGSYERAVSFLNKLKETKIYRRINTMLSKQTIDSIEHIIKLAEYTGCGISFIPLRTMGKETNFKDFCALDRELMLLAVKQITKIGTKYPSVEIETFFDILEKNFIAHHPMDFNTPCPAGKNAFISYNGDVFPCDWIRYTGNRFLCGNVRSDNIFNIYHHSDVLKQFQAIKRIKCTNCKFYLKRCYGGCFCSYNKSLDNKTYEDELCFNDLLPESECGKIFTQKTCLT